MIPTDAQVKQDVTKANKADIATDADVNTITNSFQQSPTASVYSEGEPDTKQQKFSWIEEITKPNDTNRRNVDALNEAARASALGRDPVIAFQSVKQSLDYDPDARAEMFLRNTGESLAQIQNELLLKAQEGVPVAKTLADNGITPLQSSSSDAMAAAKSYVVSIPSSKQLTPKERDDVAFLKYLDFMTAKVADDIGLNMHTVSDIGGYLVPQENLRYSQVADVLGIDYNAMDYVDYADFLGRTSAYIRSEAPEKRQQLVETLISAWPEIRGNNRLALVDFLSTIGEGADNFRHIESGIERVDQATLGYGLASGKFITGALRTLNVIRTASKLKNVEAVADAVTMGAKGVLKEAGVEPIEALATLDPSAHINTLVKGADNTYATEVSHLQRDVDIYLDAADRVNSYGLGLNENEKLLARDRAVDNLLKQGSISDVKATAIDEKTFQLSFSREDSNGGPNVKFTTKASYVKDDVGGFVSVAGEGHTALDAKLTSPNFRFISDRDTLIQAPEQLQYQGAAIQSLYDDAVNAALKTLSRNEVKTLDFVLSKGDEFVDELGNNVGKLFTRDEAVVQGIEGVKLTEKQYQAYTDVRKVVDHLHYAKDKEIKDLWKSKNIKVVDWAGEQAPAKSYETANDAVKGFNMASTRSHWIAVDGGPTKAFKEATELTPEIAEEMYARGFKLVKSAEGRMLKDGNSNVEWAFVEKAKIREPSGMVLNYRTGYMPKIKKDAFYFVKELHDVTVGGTHYPNGLKKTVRYFDNHGDATTYADSLNKLNPDKYVVLADREMSYGTLNDEFINISGGLFTGKRSEGVPFGLAGQSGTRADSLEGLQRYISNIARNAPMSLYREGIEQRWLNHAKDLKALPSDYNGSFSEAVHPQHLAIDNPSAAFLKDSHAQISFFTGVRTEAEREMLAKQRLLARSLERVPIVGKPLSRKVLNSSLEGAVGTLRGVSFNMMLGMYNPAQFLIQASGGLVALSINPIHGAKAISQLPMFSAIDVMLSNPVEKANVIKKLRSAGFDLDGYEIWDKSGIRESIVKSNLDYHSLWSDKPYNANFLQKILSNSTVAFKQGELVSARLAFATAFNHWKALNPEKAVDMLATKAILARTEIYRLNMSKVNSAGFQKGLMSLPTQYQQVNTKFFEKLIGRGELTKPEKTRLIATQAALFGAAGVPLMSTIMPHVLDMINFFRPEGAKINAENTDPATLNAIYNGGLAWVLNDYMDIESVITGRMSLGQDFIENLFGTITGQVDIPDFVLGPFSSIWGGVKHGVERTMTALTTVMSGDDAKTEDFAAVGQILARSVLEIPSSTRNLYKAYDMTHSEFFKNKAGRPVAEWGDLNTQTIVAQALGFSPQEVTDYYELNSRAGGNIPKSVVSGEADRIVRMLADMANSPDEQQARWNAMAANAIFTKYKRQEDRIVLINEIKTKLSEPTNAWGTLMNKVLVDWQSELNSGLAEIHKQSKEQSSPAVARKLASVGMNTAVAEEVPSDSFKDGTVTLTPVTDGEVQRKTKEGRKVYQTPEGDFVTERSITVTDNRINEGKPTNIPSVYGGTIMSEEVAISIIADNKGIDPETGRKLLSFNSIKEAVRAAEERTKGLGKQLKGDK